MDYRLCNISNIRLGIGTIRRKKGKEKKKATDPDEFPSS